MNKIVFQKDGVIYSAVLSQTNITKNSNKYYKIQILCCGGNQFQIVTCWGRIGRKRGQDEVKTFKSPENAMKEFENKYESKTGHPWSRRNETHEKDTQNYHSIELEKEILLRPYFIACIDDDLDHMPLGILSKKQIFKGIDVLKKMSSNFSNKKLLIDQTNRFFSIIPHTFGRSFTDHFKSIDQINDKIEALKGWMNESIEESLSK